MAIYLLFLYFVFLASCGKSVETFDTKSQPTAQAAPSAEVFTLLDGTQVFLSRDLSTQLTKQGSYSQGVLADASEVSLEAAMASMPNHARQLIGSAPSGPNCFNFVRHYFDAKHPLETEEPSDFAGYLKNKMTPLSPGQRMESGDVITVWQTFLPVQGALMLVNDFSEVYSQLRHAAVYLGNGWVAEKPGIESDVGPYRVVSSLDSFDNYWKYPSLPTGFIGTEREDLHYSNRELPPTIVVFRVKK